VKRLKNQGTMKTVFFCAEECKGKMILSVLCAIISVTGGIVPYFAVYQIIIQFFESVPVGWDILFWAAVSVVGYLVKLLFYGISTTLSHISAYKILENIRLSITTRLMRAPLGVTLNRTAGNLKSVIVDRVETIELPLAHMIPEGISNLLLPIAVFIYMVIIDRRMALASFVCVPLGAATYIVMMKNFNKQYADYMTASNHVNSVIVEYVEGIEVIKAFGRSGSSYEKFAKAVKDFKTFTLAWFNSTWKLMNLGGAILPSTLFGILPIGLLLYIRGTLTPVDLTICMILSLGIIGPVTWFTTLVDDYKAIEYALKDAEELLDLPELPDTSEIVTLQGYDVNLRHVSFSYDPKNGDVLHDINLNIPQGSFTALVGPSGGGKSTVARLIARFWDVRDGGILIGGVDIRKIPLSQLGSIVSFVTQDNFLFNCSLLENIRLGKPDASDDEVFAAARAAQCEEFIGKLEQGWDTAAGEAGDKLSGGERQRITIARAILKNAPIVILDEATAFTDPENEDKLQRSIGALTKGKTLLVIAHRLSTIQKADQIVLLKDGRVDDAGTQSELLERSGLYRELWQAHTRAKVWAAGKDAEGDSVNVSNN
jgi:ATP-binding cassette subfamily B protein